MALTEYYVGDVGPLYVDDSVGTAFRSDLPISPGPPTDPSHAMRLVDMVPGSAFTVPSDKTSSRDVAGTAYQNTSGKPILVSILISCGAVGNANAHVQISSGGVTYFDTDADWCYVVAGTGYMRLNTIVPDGYYCKAFSAGTLLSWVEWSQA